MQELLETQVWSLGQKDTLEKEMATHSSFPAREIPNMGRRDWQAIVYGVAKNRTHLSSWARIRENPSEFCRNHNRWIEWE